MPHEGSEENRKGIFKLRSAGQGIPVPGNGMRLAMRDFKSPYLNLESDSWELQAGGSEVVENPAG